MTTSNYPATQYTAEQFVESSGAILFSLSDQTKQVCLIHYLAKNEWLLAKGRRNCGESRLEAALREVEEETGYKCHIHPVTMTTRAPGATEADDVSDQARKYPGLREPFMLTIREMGTGSPGRDVKLIWWFIAAVDEKANDGSSAPVGENGLRATFFPYEEALQKLSFRNDREVLERAMVLVENE